MFQVGIYINNEFPVVGNNFVYSKGSHTKEDLREYFKDMYYHTDTLRHFTIPNFDMFSLSCYEFCLKIFENVPENIEIRLGVNSLSRIPQTILSRAIIHQDNSSSNIYNFADIFSYRERVSDIKLFNKLYIQFCSSYNPECFKEVQVKDFINQLKKHNILNGEAQ